MTLTAERLRELVEYDPATGVMTWKKSRPGVKVSKAIGAIRDGYRRASVDRKSYAVHRLAWLYVHGEWPNGEIDHINGVRDDNKLINLRVASRQQQTANSRVKSDNLSGAKGVCWHAKEKLWRARIWLSGRATSLGYFRTKEEAECAYRAAAERHFGEFASHLSRPTRRAEARSAV